MNKSGQAYDTHFCQLEFSTRLIANDQSVMRSANMKIIEETGQRTDDYLIRRAQVLMQLFQK